MRAGKAGLAAGFSARGMMQMACSATCGRNAGHGIRWMLRCHEKGQAAQQPLLPAVSRLSKCTSEESLCVGSHGAGGRQRRQGKRVDVRLSPPMASVPGGAIPHSARPLECMAPHTIRIRCCEPLARLVQLLPSTACHLRRAPRLPPPSPPLSRSAPRSRRLTRPLPCAPPRGHRSRPPR